MAGDMCPLSIASGNLVRCNPHCKLLTEQGKCKLELLIDKKLKEEKQ